MKKLTTSWLCVFITVIAFFNLTSCGGDNPNKPTEETTTQNKDFTVNVHLASNVDNLNLFIAKNVTADEVMGTNVHAQLLERDHKTLAFRPFLAKELPEIKHFEDGSMHLIYEIRPEATWDNGTPIQASDVLFTLKAIKNPLVQASPLRGYFAFIEDLIIDENNPKKFTLVSSEPYFLAKDVSGSITVFPEYFYDEQGFMAEFTLAELNDASKLDELKENPRIKGFAEEFNTNYSTDPEKVVGAGAYKITESNNHQNITLERKASWWGDKVDVPYITANPKKILYKIMDNENTAITNMKDLAIDVMTRINAEKFLTLKELPIITENFNLHTPNTFGYYYIGMNMKKPKLKDVRVREAMSHLVDKKRVIDDLMAGLGVTINGPVNPNKSYYNEDIETVSYDLDKARTLLAEAGWGDSDGDNILDKKIDGKQVDLTLEITYPQGRAFYKDVATNLKYEAERVGIAIELNGMEGSSLQKKIMARDYELMCLGWGGVPMPDDFTQLWHSESNRADGSNLIGFGTDQTDALIEKIRVTTDEEKRTAMYKEFQELVVKEHPYVFLLSPQSCTAINSKFTNTKVSSVRPGYTVRLFELAK